MADNFSYRESDPASLLPTWGALRTHGLFWQPGWDLPALLAAWEPRLTGLDDPDTAAIVTLPSHATGRHPVELNMHTVRYDAAFGMVTERPNSAVYLRSTLAGVLDRDHEAMWLAVHDDTPIGMIYVDMPTDAGWMARYTDTRPFAYLGHLGVRPDVRGSGAAALSWRTRTRCWTVPAWHRRCSTTLCRTRARRRSGTRTAIGRAGRCGSAALLCARFPACLRDPNGPVGHDLAVHTSEEPKRTRTCGTNSASISTKG